jgi:hypothetical protein
MNGRGESLYFSGMLWTGAAVFAPLAISEPEIEPDGMADDLRRKSMARIGN